MSAVAARGSFRQNEPRIIGEEDINDFVLAGGKRRTVTVADYQQQLYPIHHILQPISQWKGPRWRRSQSWATDANAACTNGYHATFLYHRAEDLSQVQEPLLG